MRYLIIAVLLSTSVLLYAENQLDIVWQQHGEQANDNFGMSVISLDFNGDDIDDLAVNAYRYLNNENYEAQRGKLYIYYGSDEGLPDEPSITISTEVDTTLNWRFSWITIENLGDMNNDNCDEIGYTYCERTHNESYHYFYSYRILEGNTVNDTLTDHIYESESSYSDIDIHPLGDINGDGYDDAGVTEYDYPGWLTYSIIYGGSFEKVVFVDSIYTRTSTKRGFRGLGDVNNDGYDDFSYYYEGETIENPDETFCYHHYNRFFWGGTVQDTIPDASIDYVRHTSSVLSNSHSLQPAGDWDNDGYADFLFSSYDLDENFEVLGTRLWRGGETIDWDRYTYILTSLPFYPAFGDINGDQKIDYVDTYGTEYGGYLYFFLGNQNGTRDYYEFNDHYGYGCGPAIGDFDNDGYDDIAVGAWGDTWNSPSNYGDLYVYAGHANLVELDPNPVDEETVPPADITFNAYPNPFNPEISFEIKTDKKYNDLKIEIYNIKGQRVETIAVDHAGETVVWKPQNKASGVYTCKLSAEGKELSLRKVTLLK